MERRDMKRFLGLAVLGLTTLGLGSGNASAWWPLSHCGCCFSCKKTCCYQYNAFSPYCCYLPPGHYAAGYANGNGCGHNGGYPLEFNGHLGGHGVIISTQPATTGGQKPENIQAPKSGSETKSSTKDGQTALPLNSIPEGAILQGPIPQGTIFQGNINQGGIMMGSPSSIDAANGEAPSLMNRFQDIFTPANRGNIPPGGYWNGTSFRR
jgi:hypothetical protein